MIIGLTGSMGSGKGEVTRVLEGLGFKYITLSQMVREEARNRGVEEEREKLMEVGNSMRQAEGPGVLGKRALEKIQASDHENWVVDGIRNPAEIDELKKDKSTTIVALDADREELIQRILKRGRASDPKSREDVLARIEREWGKGESGGGQQMEKCVAKADLTLENRGTLQELDEKVIDLYNELSSK